jgi:hypothetical protein
MQYFNEKRDINDPRKQSLQRKHGQHRNEQTNILKQNPRTLIDNKVQY